MAEKPNQPKKAAPVLVLPSPHRISGDVDAMLESTVAERFKSIILVRSEEKDEKKGQVVLSHLPDSKDPNVQVSTWNPGLGHLLRFIMAGINAYTSGIGLSGDGSAIYVAKNAKMVFDTVPQLKGYDIYLVPNGRGGVAKYRIAVQELVSQVTNRAKVIQANVETYGVAQGKERTKKAESAPQITLIL